LPTSGVVPWRAGRRPGPSGVPGLRTFVAFRRSRRCVRPAVSDPRSPVAGAAPLERAPLVLTHTAPDARVLAALQSPAQALGHHRAAPADGLRLLDLQQSRPGVPDREEQLRVLVTAEGAVAPVHRSTPLVRVVGPPPDRPGRLLHALVNSFTRGAVVKVLSDSTAPLGQTHRLVGRRARIRLAPSHGLGHGPRPLCCPGTEG